MNMFYDSNCLVISYISSESWVCFLRGSIFVFEFNLAF